jgi:Uncharacterized conserved protein
MSAYTACYTKTETGYTGQLLEWPEIVSEGASIEECRAMLADATREMIAVYEEDGKPIPQGHTLFESITIEEASKAAV